MSSKNSCMILWLRTFCAIHWMVMSRSKEVKIHLWIIYYLKRGTLAGWGHTYPSWALLKKEAGGPFPISSNLISIEVIGGPTPLAWTRAIAGRGEKADSLPPVRRGIRPAANNPGGAQYCREGHWPVGKLPAPRLQRSDPTLTLESFAKALLLRGQTNIDLTFYALRKAGLKWGKGG